MILKILLRSSPRTSANKARSNYTRKTSNYQKNADIHPVYLIGNFETKEQIKAAEFRYIFPEETHKKARLIQFSNVRAELLEEQKKKLAENRKT